MHELHICFSSHIFFQHKGQGDVKEEEEEEEEEAAHVYFGA
jgi:hypothetical protein